MRRAKIRQGGEAERKLAESAEGDGARVGRGVGDAASRRCELDRMRKHANAAE